MPYAGTDMILYFFIYSFCGWLMETVLCSFQEKHFVNRGFLNGPICPIYGCGILLILIFLLPVRNTITNLVIAIPVIFVAGALLASIVEYATSWLMEKLFHARWWDYSHIRFNLNGRICLVISLAWGGLATAFVYLVQPLFENLVHMLYAWNLHLPMILSAALCVILAADCVVSFRVAKAIGNKLEQMEKLGELIKVSLEDLSSSNEKVDKLFKNIEYLYEQYGQHYHELKDRLQLKTEEWVRLTAEKRAAKLHSLADEFKRMRASVMKHTDFLQKRMLRAFPKFKPTSGDSALADWRRYLHNHGQTQQDAVAGDPQTDPSKGETDLTLPDEDKKEDIT